MYFFDRDGVINHDAGYTHKFENFRFRKKCNKNIKLSYKKKILYFLLSQNRAGIAKKVYFKKNFYELHNKIKNKLSYKNIFFDDVQFCPHHPDGKIRKYSIECKCRKPSDLMIKRLKEKWFINIKKSIFIGDKITDEMAAKKSKK